jgi:hypothetical protein
MPNAIGWRIASLTIVLSFPTLSMSYRQFKHLEQSIEAFELTVVESVFFPVRSAVVPSEMFGYGQCVAEMVAAIRFNQHKGRNDLPVYGCVSNGLLWRFLKLEQQTVTIDLTDYTLNPLGDLLAKLMWMASEN